MAKNNPFFYYIILISILMMGVKSVPFFLPHRILNQKPSDVTKMEIARSSMEDEVEYSDSSPPRELLLHLPANCPNFCTCDFDGHLTFTVRNCTHDPTSSLNELLNTYDNITKLNILSSGMKALPEQVCRLNQLITLDLSNNTLQDLPWDCLKKLLKLSSLSLKNNQLRKLKNGTIYGFQSLESLVLAGNQISEIEIDTFGQIEKLPPLNFIDLSANNLVSIDACFFNYFQSGRRLNLILDDNHISAVTNKLGWKFKCNLKKPWAGVITMKNNNIQHISDLIQCFNIKFEFAFACLLRSDELTLDVRNNPFTCDCVDYRIYVAFHNVHQSVYVNRLFCEKPDNLYDQKIITVPLDEFVCHVKDRCPEGCNCINVPNQMNMTVDCSGTGLERIPDTLPDLPLHNYHYNLYFANNNLTHLTDRKFFNHTMHADFSNNKINNISIQALESLKNTQTLGLDHNRLSKMPVGILGINLTSDDKLYLEGNPWNCDCHFHETRNWVNKFKSRIVDSAGLLCVLPTRFEGTNIMNLKEDDMICGDPPNIQQYMYIGIAGSTLIGSVIIFVLPVYVLFKKRVWLYRKLKWHPFELDECVGEDKEFDLFVSYANEDEDYVDSYLLPELQDRGYRICYHRVHFPPGQPIINSIEQCIRASKRTLVVFSNNFKVSQWCMWEFSVALELNQNAGTHRLMAILYDDVDVASLDLTVQAFFSKYTYIEKDSDFFWDNLQYGLPQNKMGREDSPYDVIGPPRSHNHSNIPEEEEQLLESDQLAAVEINPISPVSITNTS